MAKFRMKPVMIEAEQYMAGRELPAPFASAIVLDEMYLPCVKTPKGTMSIGNFDWIIKHVNGEFYPCKPDIFAATYEPA